MTAGRGRRAAIAVAAVVVVMALARVGFGAFSAVALPAPRITSAPIRPTTSTSATFAFQGAPGTTFECKLDAGDFRGCPSPVTYRGLGIGAHAFEVRARAALGSAGPAATFAWRIVPRRSSKPVLRPVLTTVPLRPWLSANATFAWRGPARASFECRLDRGRWSSCRAPRTYVGLEPGPHVFRVRSIARDGWRSRPNRFAWVIVDAPLAAPPTFVQTPQILSSGGDATFAFEVPDGAAVECSLDGGPWSACASPMVLVGLEPGAHVLCVRVLSPEGVPGVPACYSWTVAGSTPGGPGGGGGAGSPSGALILSGSLSALLAPGSGGVLPLKIENTFGEPLNVTSIEVAVEPGSSRPGCDGPANLDVTPSNASGGAVSVVVPAHSSVTLPSGTVTAPAVAMRNLATNQDACKGARFRLRYAAVGSGVG